MQKEIFFQVFLLSLKIFLQNEILTQVMKITYERNNVVLIHEGTRIKRDMDMLVIQ